MIWTMQFWKGAGERGLKTFVQTFTATLFVTGTIQVTDVRGLATMPWETSVITASLAALLSLLTSIGNANFTAGKDTDADRLPSDDLKRSNLS